MAVKQAGEPRDQPVIVWLRRDVRLRDHTALDHARQTGQPLLLTFVFDPALLHTPRLSIARLEFMLAALATLDAELRQYGSRLVIRHGDPVEQLARLAQATGAAGLYYHVDYTPYARQRDARVTAALQTQGVAVHALPDRLLVTPDRIATGSGKPYTVFTPFKNKWRETERNAAPLTYDPAALTYFDLSPVETPPLPALVELGFAPSGVNIPAASESAAQQRLDTFMQGKVYGYKEDRNRLANPDDARQGTSLLSPYIRFGLLSLRQIRAAAADAYRRAERQTQRDSVTAFMDEIIWHEFYTHILWHFPQVKTANFNQKYDAVVWRNDADDFRAWQAGKTGYPVVDAAMRQLNTLGWMHNRARMIVASFLTRDLLLDWRIGERYFMQKLLDGDLAANNGGWQWSAGTGTDAQPYFRIFNPVAQSVKFDPDGAFIRQWVPELRDVPDQYIHTPWEMTTPPAAYPAPLVDHAVARDRALAAFRVLKAAAR